ncbi:MAG TPA: PilZ domain-containing protein [Pyrinomonadaceae bacterium]|nr:PilZ domain-containing protein [Pyrinomonadaceae bacterium]
MGLARSIVSRLRRYAGERRHSNRQNIQLPFSILFGGPTKSVRGNQKVHTLEGHTLNISAGGLALIVPAIRVGEHHLVGESRGFSLRLELPEGPVNMKVATVRYESLDEHPTEQGFLVGVKIVEIEEADRRTFTEFVSKSIAQSALK